MIYKRSEVVILNKLHKIIQFNLLVVFIFLKWEDDKYVGGWLRLFGNWKGVVWKSKYAPKLFSERNGYAKSITIGNCYIKFLK